MNDNLHDIIQIESKSIFSLLKSTLVTFSQNYDLI